MFIIELEQWDGSYVRCKGTWLTESEAIAFAHRKALVGWRVRKVKC